MYSPRYSGLTTAGVFEGTTPSIFIGGIPAVENSPPFELKTIDSEVIRLIKVRYKAVLSRVDALFPCGASRSTTPTNLSNYLVACSRLSKSTLLKPFIISCTLDEIPADSHFTRLRPGRRDLPTEYLARAIYLPGEFPFRQGTSRSNQGRDRLFSQPTKRDRVMRVQLGDIVAAGS